MTNPRQNGRDRTVSETVTPAMIEAGVAAYFGWDDADDPSKLAAAVYRSMQEARNQPMPPAASSRQSLTRRLDKEESGKRPEEVNERAATAPRSVSYR